MYITKRELELIAKTPKKECLLCDTLINHCSLTLSNKLCISDKLLTDKYIREHLRQVIGR